MKRHSNATFQIVEGAAGAATHKVLDLAFKTYEAAQTAADLFNKFLAPRREFAVTRDGHPIRRRARHMARFYAKQKEIAL